MRALFKEDNDRHSSTRHHDVIELSDSLRKYSLSRCFLLLFYMISVNLHAASPSTWYTAGLGMGRSTVSGDYSMAFAQPIFELGFDYESDNLLFQFIGSSAMDKTFKSLQLFVGGGNRYIKLGIGVIGMNSSIPTEKQTLNYYAADESRYTRASASSVPLFLRIHPYTSERWIITLDGHYGLKNNGSLTIPTLVFGLPATISTEPQRSQGRYGVGGSILWRPSHDYNLAMRLSYTYNVGEMNAGTTSMEGGLLSNFIQIRTPQLRFVTKQIMLSAVWLINL